MASRAHFSLAVVLAVAAATSPGPATGTEAPRQLASKATGPVVTFAGLRVHSDTSSQLWVEMSQKGNVTVKSSGMTLTFLIEGARIDTRNNENPLRAEYFGANVLSAKLDRKKEGVTFTIRLRTATETRYRVLEQADGAVLQVDVPPPLKSSSPG